MSEAAVAPNSSLLSPVSLPIIEATLPVVGENLGEISRIFYDNLFGSLPLLEKDLFNEANQESGEQQKALAGAVAAFATLLVTEDAPPVDHVMSRIAAKHASLGITPVHYDLVHRALFKAIVQVLGDAVTAEVAAAWDEVYWLMANSLIKQEAGIYEKVGVSAGQIWTALTVVGRREIAPGVWTFTLAGDDNCPMKKFEAGQYASVSVIYEDGSRQIRQYTVMAGQESGTWEFTVSPVPGGRVSNKLIAEVGVGYPLVVSIPSGTPYPIPGDGPIVLGSSGVGAALTVAVLQAMVEDRDTRPVHVFHVDNDEASFGHRAQILELLRAYAGKSAIDTFYVGDMEEGLGLLRKRDWDRKADVYLCGSPQFMRQVRKIAVVKGVRPEHIHYEVFAPDSWLGFD
ncbi:FAD-binding oxidoreductase [Prescottella soli]|uniref:nitric oxide dioxygenase n=1 Tax=Prescottella soli TaxID=1543852 RepID=A0ABW9FR76_9NOCA